MNCLAPAAHFALLVSRNVGYERLSFALNLFVGRGRQYTVSQASKGSGVPERAIECAKYQPHQHEFRPLRYEYLLSLNAFLGASFVSACLEPCGIAALDLMEAQPPLPHVLASAPSQESPEDERRRLIRRLMELEEEQ